MSFNFAELRFEEDAEHRARVENSCVSCAENDNICVVMNASQISHIAISAKCGADAVIAVCNHRHTDAGCADEYAAVNIRGLNSATDIVPRVRIIKRVFAETTDVKDIIAPAFKFNNNFFFKVEAAVVAADSDFEIIH